MNTTAKGDAFEKKIYHLFRKWIKDDLFIASSKRCKIFAKKGYYSRDREGEIIFDIAIEIYNPGSSELAILYLIECKNYSHAVPVNDAEEFASKMAQVHASKGIIVTAGPVQDGTMRYCASQKIGLLRYLDSSNVQWVLHRSPSIYLTKPSHAGELLEVRRGLLCSEVSSRFDFAGTYAGLFTNCLYRFFAGMAEGSDPPLVFRNIQPNGSSVVDYIPNAAIERNAQAVVDAINYSSGKVDLEAICQWQREVKGLVVRKDFPPTEREIQSRILGRLSFEPLEITTFSVTNESECQQRFTLAHEFGHLFLSHGQYMKAEYTQAKNLNLGPTLPLNADDISRMEWQANYFASCLLLPHDSFTSDFFSLAKTLKLRDRGFGVLYLDEQRCNLGNYYYITSALEARYSASRTAVKLRLERLGLLTDGTRKPQQAGEFFSSIFSE